LSQDIKPHLHCVRHCTATHARGHTSTQDTTNAKLYDTYRCCQWA